MLLIGVNRSPYTRRVAMEEGAAYLLPGRLTQADVTAFVAERLARGLGIDTDAQTRRLHALTRKLLGEGPFRVTEP
jgi:glutathione S-transferase